MMSKDLKMHTRFLVIFLSLVALPGLVLATGGDGTMPGSAISLFDPFGCPPPSAGGSCFAQILRNIIGRLLDIVYPILAGIVFYGGMQMMFARGNSEKYNAGKRTIFYAVVGFAVILVSQGIALILYDLLTLGRTP